MIGYVGVDEQVDKDFYRTLQRASLHRWRDRVLRRSSQGHVLSFEEAKGALKQWSQVYRGMRTADEEEVVLSIRAVGRGEAIFSPAVAIRVLAYFSKPAAPPQVFPTLTDREREILNLIAQGHPNPSIAKHLSLSTKTVGNYVSNIFTKLQVADRAQAIIRAREAGMG